MNVSRVRAMVLGAAGLALVSVGAAGAADHGSHEGGHVGMMQAGGQSAAAGVEIRTATAEGYQLKYRLLSWEERNVAMKGMEGMEMAGMDNSGNSTHHLMLYVANASGKEVSGGKVGFQVTRPDGGEQKTLTMAMGGGYGADVNLKGKGMFTIRTKLVDGARTVTDTFTHEVK